MGNTKTDLQNCSREQLSLFPANYACTCKTTVLENSLTNAFSNLPPPPPLPHTKKNRRKGYRFRIWRLTSNPKFAIQNLDPDFPIEHNLSKLQFRKLVSSSSNFTPKWLKDLCVSLQQERWWYWARRHFRRVLEKKRWQQYREQTNLPASVSHLYASANDLAFSVFRDFILITWWESEKHYANKAEIYASIRE